MNNKNGKMKKVPIASLNRNLFGKVGTHLILLKSASTQFC